MPTTPTFSPRVGRVLDVSGDLWVDGCHGKHCRLVLSGGRSRMYQILTGCIACTINSQLRESPLFALLSPPQPPRPRVDFPHLLPGSKQIEAATQTFLPHSSGVWSLTPRLQPYSESQRCLRQWFLKVLF